MNAKPIEINRPELVPTNAEVFYRELTTRNRHFVKKATQERLSKLKVLIAGCGAGGGACISPLARLGVQNFRIADNGAYELNNLNRQRAYIPNLGQNKSEFHAKELLSINPFVDVKFYSEGITPDNIPEVVQWADLIIDAVDVTTASAIAMKVAMHECAQKNKKPVLCPLDPGFGQWGMSFDYRNSKVKVMGGRSEAVRAAKHPVKALMIMYPMQSIPPHSRQLIIDLLSDGTIPASQLACSADLLSGVIGAAVIRFAETGYLVKGWYIDVISLALPLGERIKLWFEGFGRARQIRRLVRTLE